MTSKITIDLEPTWATLCKISAEGDLDPAELMPACIIADKVRQAQKAGALSIVFEFGTDGIDITENFPKYPELDQRESDDT